MQHSHFQFIEKLANEMVATLMEEYGVTVEGLTPGHHENSMDLVALIGFSGDHIHGTLAFAATSSLISASNVLSANPSEAECRDWIGELSNQLLGRVKNRLVAHGPVLSMGTPMVVSGREMQPMYGKHDLASQNRFSTSIGLGEVWIQVTMAPEFHLDEEPAVDAADTCEEEGSLLFF